MKDQKLFQLSGTDYDNGGNYLSSEHSEDIDKEKGVMPKQIVVRIGAKVMIIRNLDVAGGVVNGTVGILQSVHKKVLMVKRLDGSEIIPIPKVKQKIQLKNHGISVYRVQYPIILSWACTVHKAQGMTLGKCFVYMENSFFASGQVYVALSRVSKFEDLHLLSFSNKAIKANPVVTEFMQHAKEAGCLKTARSKGGIKKWNMEAEMYQEVHSLTQKCGIDTVPSNSIMTPETDIVVESENQHSTVEVENHSSSQKRQFLEMKKQTYNTLRVEIAYAFFNPRVVSESITRVLEQYRPTFNNF